MDATLTEEEALFADVAKRVAEATATTDSSAILDPESSGDAWRRVVDLGLPALRSPALSGIDASGVECALAIEALACTLAPVPALGQAVIVPELLDAAGAHGAAAAVADGTLRIAPALTRDLTALAPRTEGAVAFDAFGATHALVAHDDSGGRRLAAYPLASVARPALDLTRALHDLDSSGPMLDVDLGTTIPPERWTAVESCALMAVAADLVGVMQGALDDAITYAGDRRQFGVPIGTFQAVQHLAADAFVALEGARSCVLHAAWALGRLPYEEALLAARTAKAAASRAGREVVETTVQILGGIAITWESLAHLRLRRALLDRAVFGDENAQYRAIADQRLRDPALL